MGVREQIMGLPCNAMNSYSDSEFSRYRVGFHHAKIKAANIAEASEKKLLGRVKIWKMRAERLEEEKDSLIAELSAMPEAIGHDEYGDAYGTGMVSIDVINAILAKYEAKS